MGRDERPVSSSRSRGHGREQHAHAVHRNIHEPAAPDTAGGGLPMMNILHVINTLSGAGAQMNVVRLATHANRARVEPHLAYCGHWPLETELEQSSVPLLRLDECPRRVRSVATPLIIG